MQPWWGGFCDLDIHCQRSTSQDANSHCSVFFCIKTWRPTSIQRLWLSGKIPISTQLESFDPSIYLGNPKLCGLPLPNKCPREEIIVEPPILVRGKDKRIQEDDDKFITTGFYVSMGLGFILGFWTAFGTMIFNIPSRHPYFEFLDRIQNWFYVTVALSMARLQRMLQR